MKKVFMIVASLVVLAVIALFVAARVSSNGQAPGLMDGRLAHCPDTPNCVCSEYAGDRAHFIAPFELPAKTTAEALELLREAILAEGGTIRAAREDYLAATYSTPLFGFVDDLEVRIDTARGQVQVRSASRVGRGDLGANRKRVERLRELLREDRPGRG